MLRNKVIQSKILKTKKRLSEDYWLLSSLIISVFGLFSVFVFCMRVIALSWNYSLVNASIPILLPSLEVRGEQMPFLQQNLSDEQGKGIGLNTAMLVLTETKIFFGSVESFTRSYLLRNNKYELQNQNGELLVEQLTEIIKEWKNKKEVVHGIKDNGVVVLLPVEAVPMAIVIQLIQYLKSKNGFDHVVLAQGLN